MANSKKDDWQEVPLEDTSVDDWQEVSLEDDLESNLEPESRTGEAFLSGFGSGATASFSDELGGAIGAGVETAASYIPGTDAYEARKLDEKLREQGFTGDLQDKQSLLDKYIESRDYIRDYQKGLQEQHPIASGAGELTGGLVTAPLVPSATAAKGASLGTKMYLAGKQGLAGGLAYGAGASESDLTKGEVGGFLKDTAESGVGGAFVGGVLPAAGALIKGTGQLIPGAKSLSAGYGYGKEGQLLTKENVGKDIQKLSNKIYKGIRSRLDKYGLKKEEAMDLADQAGIRINAGETLDDLITEAMDKRSQAKTKHAREFMDDWIETLNEIAGKESKDAAKVRKGAEVARAKEAVKHPDAEIGDVEPFIQDNRVGAKFDVTELDKKTRRLVDKPKGIKVGAERTDTANIYDLSVRELDDMIKNLRDEINVGGRIATPEERGLLSKLRKLRDEAVQSQPKTKRASTYFKKESDLLAGMEDLGIDKISSKRGDIDVARKVDKISDLLEKTTSTAERRKQRAYNQLKAADPRFGRDVEKRGKQLQDLQEILNMEGIRSTNIKGLAGAASTMVGKIGNVAGKARYGMGEVAKDSKKILLDAYKSAKKMSPERLSSMADSMEKAGGAGLQYANQLRKAAMGDGKTKTAALHGLYQQPGFRELVKRFDPFFEEEE